ncbi:MAG: ribbon-helix-helix protein, CopG family [Chloroflexota bacterium]
MMSDNQQQYPHRLSVQVTDAMNDLLDQVAERRDEPKSEVVRTALRIFLDEQADLIGSRKYFSKMFQRRVDYLERLLTITLWLNVQTLQILYERIRKEPYELASLLEDAISTGITSEDTIHTLVERISQKKTKPPA